MKSRYQRLEGKRKRRKMRLDKKGPKREPYQNENGTIRDRDIVLRDVQSRIISRLIRSHNSVFLPNDPDVYYFYWDNVAFFSLADRIQFPADYSKDLEFFRELGDDALIDVPVLKALYVIESRRRSGYQRKILEKVMSLSERFGEPILGFASPYKLGKPKRGLFGICQRDSTPTNASDALATFLEAQEELEDAEGFEEQLENQIARLENLRWQNCDFEFRAVTELKQAMVYVPSSCETIIRKVIESRLVA